MARITIDVETLRSYARTLSSRISDYEALNSRFDTLTSSICATWKGKAGEAYASKMLQYGAQAKSLVNILTQFMKYAEETANEFDNLDAECAARIRQSF